MLNQRTFHSLIRLKNTLFLLSLMVMALLLSACGQKGDLYIENTPTQVILMPKTVQQPALVAEPTQSRRLTKAQRDKQMTGFVTRY